MTQAGRDILQQAHDGLNEALQFIARLPPLEHEPALHRLRVAQLHAIDHLLRLHGRLQSAPGPAQHLDGAVVHEVRERMECLLELVHEGIKGEAPADWIEELGRQNVALTEAAHDVRARLLESESIEGGLARALQLTDVLRSLERSAGHVQRVCHYLLAGRQPPVEPA